MSDTPVPRMTAAVAEGCGIEEGCKLERELSAALKRVEEAERNAQKYPAIWLEGAERHWTVKIEINKQWITVIEEVHGDGGHSSHIVESAGITSAIDAARAKGKP